MACDFGFYADIVLASPKVKLRKAQREWSFSGRQRESFHLRGMALLFLLLTGFAFPLPVRNFGTNLKYRKK